MQVYTGIVQKGGQQAASLGFPTVNIPLEDDSVSGIYAAKVKAGEEEYEAVAYADRKHKKLEAHIFDFAADLYGWNITITLLKKIRENKKFSDDETLQKAIMADTRAARAYFKNPLRP